MEDGDIVEVHMEQLGGGASDDDEDWEDWAEIKDDILLQQVMEEREQTCLSRVVIRLNKELCALTANNRALAKENNSLKVDKKDLKVRLLEPNACEYDADPSQADYQELFVEFSGLMAKHRSLHSLVAGLRKEQRALNSTISQKDKAISSILEDFQFTLQ